MIRIGSNTDIGINRNSSDWFRMNSYPYVRQGGSKTDFRIGRNETDRKFSNSELAPGMNNFSSNE